MKQATKKLALSAMFMAVGIVLPFFTGQIPQIGKMLLPMHIPVFLCGLICGWQYGAAVGFILPLFRSVIIGMPPLFPVASSMAFEMAVYGFVAGFLYNRSRWQCIISLYRALFAAMIAGRVVWGMTQIIFLGITGSDFTFEMFLAGALLNAVPGILIQLIFIPAIMVALNRTGLVRFHKKHKEVVQAANGGTVSR